MNKPPQIGFRIAPELLESFKAKVEAEGSTVTKVLTELINQYVAADKTAGHNPPASSTTSTSSAPNLNTAESYQHSARVDNLERLVISMIDTSALANRIASLEIRFLDAIKLLERYVSSAEQHQKVPDSSRQAPHYQAPSAEEDVLQSRLAEIEKRLANQQQLLVKQIEKQIDDLLADTKDQLADQLAHQNEQARNLQQSIANQQSEFTDALTEIESRLSDRLNQHAAQFASLNQVVADLQKQQDRAATSSNKNSSNGSAQTSTQKSASKNKSRTNQTSKEQTGEAPDKESKPDSSTKTKKADVSHSQQSQPSTNAEIKVENGYIVIDGVRKRLLLPKEAIEIARKHGLKGDHKALEKLSRPPIKSEVYARYGLGVVPELRGGRGVRNAWYYEL